MCNFRIIVINWSIHKDTWTFVALKWGLFLGKVCILSIRLGNIKLFLTMHAYIKALYFLVSHFIS